MSIGYAQKLSKKADVGAVGMPELFDPPYILQHKVEQLAVMIQKSKHLVAFTGAGISTSCGIPDFRGPKGIWTLQKEGKGVPDASVPFDRAMPSLTHMALVELEKAGILKFVISQNVDGLHLRSGLPKDKLAELHGNSFKEVCSSCGVEYVRDFEVETIGLKKTPRRCLDEKCKARLRDTVLDWEDELPSKEKTLAEKNCELADVVLCLGTSLQITPACDFPLKCQHNGGKVVIVNLQQTQKDKQADLVVHGLADEVISGVMNYLCFRVPPCVQVDHFQIMLTSCNRLSDQRFMKWRLRVASIHGLIAPLPFIKSVEVSFPERPELKTAKLVKQPFLLKRETIAKRSFNIMLKLNLSDGCGCSYTTVDFPVDFQAPVLDIDYGMDMVIQKLRETAIRDNCSGQVSLVNVKSLLQPKGQASTFVVVSNIHGFASEPALHQPSVPKDLFDAETGVPERKRFKIN